jgi:uncharacterized protein YbjT (DUF2867 family)
MGSLYRNMDSLCQNRLKLLAQNNQEKTAHLTKLAEGKSGKLEFFSGDLSVPKSYDEAFAGADAIVHAAAVVEVWCLFPLVLRQRAHPVALCSTLGRECKGSKEGGCRSVRGRD